MAREMTFIEFRDEVIRIGIEAARLEYPNPEDDEEDRLKLEGSIEGFELAGTFETIEAMLPDINVYHDKMVEQFKARDDSWLSNRAAESELRWVARCCAAYQIILDLETPPIQSNDLAKKQANLILETSPVDKVNPSVPKKHAKRPLKDTGIVPAEQLADLESVEEIKARTRKPARFE